MPIKYRKVQRKVIGGPDKGVMKTYAVAKASFYCDLPRLCELVSARTAMSASEVKGIIDAFLWVSDLELKAGAVVQMGEFGSFRTVIRSEGVALEEKFTPHNIRGVNIRFSPGVKLKETAKRAHYEADDVKEVVVTEECTEPHA